MTAGHASASVRIEHGWPCNAVALGRPCTQACDHVSDPCGKRFAWKGAYAPCASPHRLSPACAHLCICCPVCVCLHADELALCLVALMASGTHVRSTFTRSKLSECLALWLPEEEEASLGGG